MRCLKCGDRNKEKLGKFFDFFVFRNRKTFNYSTFDVGKRGKYVTSSESEMSETEKE